jgi:tricorn protease interacting factor F2/3
MEVRNYKLEFEFGLEGSRYFCKEVISLDLEENYDEFVLDCEDLKINKVELNEKEIDFLVKPGKLILKNLPKGGNEIFIDFENELKEVLGGIYLSKYKDGDKEKYLVTTQFEPIEARKAFPCLDHPFYKATFDVSMIIPKNLQAISNTLPIIEEDLGEKKKVIFETSPRMSTYLLYLGVGEFYFKEDIYKDVLIRAVFTPQEKIKGADFALENAKKFLSYLEDYFNEPYPLKKLDLIAIPDFASGAMENWGAITFRENLLLAFEGITPLVNRQRIAEVIAHELVHMWFGNLVTMKWWDDLWLNESFATYLAYKAVDNFYPEWKIKNEYTLNEVFSALQADSLINSHSIKVEVKDPNESVEIFDEIAYEKGGSVLRMIENYLGEENFKEGLRNYIQKFKYQNASAENLWQSLEEVSGVDVISIMKDFIEKTGYPEIKIEKENDNYYLQQKRFTFLKNQDNTLWKIPMIISIDTQEKRIILEKEKQALEEKDFEIIILNKNYSSFYLVNYDSEILRKNLENSDLLSEIDLLHLVHNLWFLTKKGEKSLDVFFDIIERYYFNNFKPRPPHLLVRAAGKPFVFSEILGILNYIDYFIENQKAKELLEKFSLKTLEVLDKKPKANELPFETRLREQALISLGKINNQEILNWSQEKFEEFLKNDSSLHPDLRLSVLNNAILINEENFEKILNYFRTTELIEEKNRCLIALGKTRFENRLKSALEFIFTPEVRFNQIPFFLNSFASNKIVKNWGFEWLENNWQKLEEKGGGPGKSDFVLIRILKWTIPNLGVFTDKNKLEEFLNQKALERFERTKRVVLEEVEINKNFLSSSN